MDFSRACKSTCLKRDLENSYIEYRYFADNEEKFIMFSGVAGSHTPSLKSFWGVCESVRIDGLK